MRAYGKKIYARLCQCWDCGDSTPTRGQARSRLKQETRKELELYDDTMLEPMVQDPRHKNLRL